MERDLFVTVVEELIITVSEVELRKPTPHPTIGYRGKLYETYDFTCVNLDTTKLYKQHKDVYLEHYEEVMVKVFELKADLEKREAAAVKAPKAQPQPTVQPAAAQPQSQPVSALGGRLEELMLKVLAEETFKNMTDIIKPQIDKYISETYGMLPRLIEVKSGSKSHVTPISAVHDKFETVLNLVENDIPTFLTGQAGTGKNHLCKQVAESLGLEFYFSNAVTNEFKITGFIDANGNYHETEFYKAFTGGGLFMLDEMDASIPEVLIILNAAIANRYFDFPNGRVNAHESFRIIAAGNTCGTGADNEYTGRLQLDAASLDRFALVEIDYSEEIELSIAKGNKELVKFIREFRAATAKCGIQHLVSYRAIDRITKLEGVLALDEVMEMCLLKHLNADDINIIAQEIKTKNNKYYQEMKIILEVKKAV